MLIGLLVAASLACKGTASSSSKEAWEFSHDPGPLAVDPSNLAHLDTSIEDSGAVYDPDLLKQYYSRRFDELPLTGHLDAVPWASTYWPSLEGGIAAPWNRMDASGDQKKAHTKDLRRQAQTFKIYSESEIRLMSPRELAALSPAHKYEIYIGDFSFPGVTWERQRTSIASEEWEGLCDGWASAALNFHAPKAVVLIGKSGITVPFGASDVEALLTYYQSKIYRDNKKTRASATSWRKVAVGGRCREDLNKTSEQAIANASECKGVNAGSFHIILGNRIGLNKMGVVIDVTRGKEVWNQPVYSYRSKILKKHDHVYASAAAGTQKMIEVETEIHYTQESDTHWHSLGAQNKDYLVKATYRYALELNKDNEIIGGEWLSWERPDYVVHRMKPPAFDGAIGHWEAIGEIYEKSLQVEQEPKNPVGH